MGESGGGREKGGGGKVERENMERAGGKEEGADGGRTEGRLQLPYFRSRLVGASFLGREEGARLARDRRMRALRASHLALSARFLPTGSLLHPRLVPAPD